MSRPRVTPAAPPEVRIAGFGLYCAAGDLPAALLGAVGTNLTAAEPHASLQGIPPGKQTAVPLLTASIGSLPEDDPPRERIALLAENALAPAVARLPAEIDGAALLVLMLVPGADSPRGRDLDHRFLQQRLAVSQPSLGAATFRFHAAETGAVEALQAAVAELAQGKWRAVLFGGADSLVGRLTCNVLLHEQQAMLQGGTGIVPGEGAAWLLLQAGPDASGTVRLGGLGAAEEPHADRADDQRMTGFATALQTALAAARIAPAAAEALVRPFAAGNAAALEWHQTLETLWPRQQTPRRFEELRPVTTLGDCGAAALPLALALGCSRFEFDHPAIDNVLVLEAGSGTARGAVCLQPVMSQATPRQGGIPCPKATS